MISKQPWELAKGGRSVNTADERARNVALLAERDALAAEAADHEKARRCCVCDGYICPPMTCTGCIRHRGDAVAITDEALRQGHNTLLAERDALAAEVDRLRESYRDTMTECRPETLGAKLRALAERVREYGDSAEQVKSNARYDVESFRAIERELHALLDGEGE